MLRLRSDEQLVALFRDGNEEAFRVIHDRYKQRLFAYTRQMLPGSRQDAEDALQDVFVRAYQGLRASDRQLSLRAWLYRVAHNRCVDELRRPLPPAPEVLGILRSPVNDPTVEAEQRESLRRLIEDVRRLPNQQRSALLMRELGGMPYSDVSGALGVSVPAVKSLLVRARMGLAQALEARDKACSEIREELAVAHDRGVRPSGLARRHMHDCVGCREFRGQMRGASRQLAALVPIGPLGVVANLLGIGGGGGAAAAGSGAGVAASGAAGTSGAVAGGVGALAGVGHVATLLAAAVVTAGGAVELQRTISGTAHHSRHHARPVDRRGGAPIVGNAATGLTQGYQPRVLQAPPAALTHAVAPSGGSAVRPHGSSPNVTSTASASASGAEAPSGNFNTTGAINEETGTSAASACVTAIATTAVAATTAAATTGTVSASNSTGANSTATNSTAANNTAANNAAASAPAPGACAATPAACTTPTSAAPSTNQCTASTAAAANPGATSTQTASTTDSGSTGTATTGTKGTTGTSGTKGTTGTTGTKGTTGTTGSKGTSTSPTGSSSPTATASSASGSQTSPPSTGSTGSSSPSTGVRLHL